MATTYRNPQSHFSSRLGTDFVPNEQESRSIKAVIGEQLSQLAVLDDEVAKAKQAYEKVLARQSAFQNSIDEHRKLVSPLRCAHVVPDDIIREIFLQCLPLEHSATIHPREPPLLLSQVCRNWRRIALATPRLWASIYLVFSDQYPEGIPSRLHYGRQPPRVFNAENFESYMEWQTASVSLWLNRSQSCLLDVTLGVVTGFVSRRERDPTHMMNKTLLETAASGSSRWKCLRINATKIVADMGDIANLSFSKLEELIIQSIHYDTSTSLAVVDIRQSLLRLSAPRLRQLTLLGIRIDFASLAAAWNQLTRLNLRGTAGPDKLVEVCHLLGLCPQLVDVTIAPYQNSYQGSPWHGMEELEVPLEEDELDTVSLLYLRSLDVAIEPECRHRSGFDTFSMPALQELGFFLDKPV